MKRPAFQFYPADWRKDAALQSCSVAAQGLWINALCIAHECEPYGHLTVNAKPMNAAQIGRLVGLSAKECASLLTELHDAGVSSIAADGAVFNRRMVRDEEFRETRATHGEKGKAFGHLGKEFGHLGAEHGVKGGRPRKSDGGIKPPPHDDYTGGSQPPQHSGDTGGLNPPQTLPPSSSASAIPIHSEPNGSGGKPPLPPDEIIFGYGVPLLVSAGATDKSARSFLGGLSKGHGKDALVDAIRDCLKAKPLQPLEWLAAALPPKGSTRNGNHDTEPGWVRERRERMQQAAPYAAVRSTGKDSKTVDMEAKNAPARIPR